MSCSDCLVFSDVDIELAFSQFFLQTASSARMRGDCFQENLFFTIEVTCFCGSHMHACRKFTGWVARTFEQDVVNVRHDAMACRTKIRYLA